VIDNTIKSGDTAIAGGIIAIGPTIDIHAVNKKKKFEGFPNCSKKKLKSKK